MAAGRFRLASLIALSMAALAAMFPAAPAAAVVVVPATVLPDAISYTYSGLNFADNIRSSDMLGTLVYTGKPGCGGTCEATTMLGSDPSVSATVNEIVYQHTSGGGVRASLGYFVAYLNAPGIYDVNLHAIDSITAPDGSFVSTHLQFGKASTATSSFNNFATTVSEDANCANGCPSPGFAIPTGPFVPARSGSATA